jgi:hypothetical protein
MIEEIAEIELTDEQLAEIENASSGAAGTTHHHWGWGHGFGFGFGGPFGYGAPFGYGYGYSNVVVAQPPQQVVVAQEPSPQAPVFELVQVG